MKPGRDIACAAGNINKVHALMRLKLVDQRGFPKSMHAQGHQVIHQVIASRHTVEDPAYHLRLFALADFLKAEMGCLSVVCVLYHRADDSALRQGLLERRRPVRLARNRITGCINAGTT